MGLGCRVWGSGIESLVYSREGSQKGLQRALWFSSSLSKQRKKFKGFHLGFVV